MNTLEKIQKTIDSLYKNGYSDNERIYLSDNDFVIQSISQRGQVSPPAKSKIQVSDLKGRLGTGKGAYVNDFSFEGHTVEFDKQRGMPYVEVNAMTGRDQFPA